MVTQDMETIQGAVLGALLIQPELVGEAAARIPAEDFVTPRCRMVYQAILDVFAAGGPVDPMPVLSRLGAQNGDEWSGYLLSLMELTPTAANIWVYADELRSGARTHRLRQLGERLAAIQDNGEAQAILEEANAQLVDKPGLRVVGMEQALVDFYAWHQQRRDYYTWGLDKLNDRLFVDGGDFVVLGGYSSAGKTLLAIQFAWHLARTGKRVGFYSLETSSRKLQDRLVSYVMGLDFGKIKRSELTAEDYEALAHASQRLIALTLEWVEASGMSVAEIRASALSRRYDVVFIDYLQLIQGEARSRYEAITDISIGLHQMSQSTGITVVALSQLSRPERGGDGVKSPTLASFRDSGQIEQDADVAMLLYKEEDTPNSRRVLYIAKNKEGEVGKIYLAFDGARQRLYESAVDAPAPKRRPEPEYRRPEFHELPPEEEDPFPQTTIGG